MIADNYYRFGDGKKKESILFITSIENIHKSSIDKIPERYKRQDYIIDKLYDRKRNVEY